MGPKRREPIYIGDFLKHFSIIAAAASVIWGASKIDSRVESIEKWIVANADTQIKLVQQGEQSKILEENQHKIMEHLNQIDDRLRK